MFAELHAEGAVRVNFLFLALNATEKAIAVSLSFHKTKSR